MPTDVDIDVNVNIDINININYLRAGHLDIDTRLGMRTMINHSDARKPTANSMLPLLLAGTHQPIAITFYQMLYNDTIILIN